MHVSGFDEPCNTPPHWRCHFHTFNRPQLGFRLKYFIRLVRIGIAYCAEAGGKKAELGKKMRQQSGSFVLVNPRLRRSPNCNRISWSRFRNFVPPFP